MAESDKSPDMKKSLDTLTKYLFNRKYTESLAQDTCVICGGEATSFKDDLSRKEFSISGMCQKCQDGVFGV